MPAIVCLTINVYHINMIAYLLLSLLAICTATNDFDDTTCIPRRSTFAEMRRVDYAKTLALGMHNCNTTMVVFNVDGHPSSTITFPATVNSYYNATSGSIDSVYVPAGGSPIMIKEYSNGQGGACIDIENNPYYVVSNDITTGAKSTAFRVITMYEKNRNKNLRAVQWLLPTNWGDSLVIVNTDDDGHFTDAIFQSCWSI